MTAEQKLLEEIKKLAWGTIEVVVKDGKPVMIKQEIKDIKLD